MIQFSTLQRNRALSWCTETPWILGKARQSRRLPQQLSLSVPDGAGCIAGREPKHDEDEEQRRLSIKQGCSCRVPQTEIHQSCTEGATA